MDDEVAPTCKINWHNWNEWKIYGARNVINEEEHIEVKQEDNEEGY